MKGRYDIVVVGGGPAGSYTARTAAAEGASVLLVEKDREIGVPVRCAEGIGAVGIRQFFDVEGRWEANRIAEYSLYSPDGTRVDIASDDYGYVLNRKLFDRDLARMAADAGAEVVTRTAATGLIREDGAIRGVTLDVSGEPRRVSAEIVVGADGVESLVGRWAGLETFCPPHDMEICAQYTMTNLRDLDPERCEMHFGIQVAPGGYLWVFSKGPDLANVGLGISVDFARARSPFEYLDEFVARRFPDASILTRIAGGVPCTGGVKQLVTDGVMLVGDAAHQPNPLSGGGVVTALNAAYLAGRVGAAAISEGDVSAKRLSEYEREWNKLFGAQHRRFYRVKETVFGLSDDVLDRTAASMNRADPEDRTLARLFRTALLNKPSLLLDVARLFLPGGRFPA